MRRRGMSKLLGLSIALSMLGAGVALAAGSPTVATVAASKIGDTTATLNASINPNGEHTTFAFVYGTTTAYGAATPAHSAGSGTKHVSVGTAISGLTPGTVYHYRVSATNASGTSIGADRTFTTTGHPPAAVVTGPVLDVGKTVATPTGSVNPEGADTTWVVRYGTSTAYTQESVPQSLNPVATALDVAAKLSGLAPGTLFHYAIFAFHGTNVGSQGADATFFTEPSKRPKPRLSARTSPGTDRRAPYTFTTNGTLKGAGSIPAPWRCAGNVGVRYFNGRRQVGFGVAPVGGDCRFSVPVSFRNLHGRGPAALTVKVSYRGTGYVAPASATDHVTAG